MHESAAMYGGRVEAGRGDDGSWRVSTWLRLDDQIPADYPNPADREITVRVLLADGQPLLGKGFRMVLSAEPDLDVVGEADLNKPVGR